MLKYRVIPCLLLHNGGLVKTVRFKSPKYVGDPINAIRIFNEKEVDELMVLDISASREGREPDYGLIEKFASECFMPLCYGGGIKTVAQAKQLFAIGVEKVCLQTAALQDLKIISDLAACFGSQSIMVSIDVKKNWMGNYKIYASHNRKTVSGRPVEYARKAVEAGTGELLLTSVDQDGTMKGYDLTLIQEVAAAVAVPLIAAGGAGGLSDLKAAVKAGASAVAAGSLFVFQGPHRAVLISYPKYADLERLFINLAT
jgi:cyclase